MTTPRKLEGLRPRRIALGLTQQEVADLFGYERATVCQWEAGKSWPSARVLPQLADLLCCSIDELYTAPEEDVNPSVSLTAASSPFRGAFSRLTTHKGPSLARSRVSRSCRSRSISAALGRGLGMDR